MLQVAAASVDGYVADGINFLLPSRVIPPGNTITGLGFQGVSPLSSFLPVNLDILAAYICLHAAEFPFEPLSECSELWSSPVGGLCCCSARNSQPRQALVKDVSRVGMLLVAP